MTRTEPLTRWPDTSDHEPPAEHLLGSATWLLGRNPRLGRLAARIRGVVYLEDLELGIDLDHLAAVVNAVPPYLVAWQEYGRQLRPPEDEDAWERWRQAGPRADDYAIGLSDFLVMSSGETAALRLLATLATERVPFRVNDLTSLDQEGQRLLADWTTAIRAAYGVGQLSE